MFEYLSESSCEHDGPGCCCIASESEDGFCEVEAAAGRRVAMAASHAPNYEVMESLACGSQSWCVLNRLKKRVHHTSLGSTLDSTIKSVCSASPGVSKLCIPGHKNIACKDVCCMQNQDFMGIGGCFDPIPDMLEDSLYPDIVTMRLNTIKEQHLRVRPLQQINLEKNGIPSPMIIETYEVQKRHHGSYRSRDVEYIRSASLQQPTRALNPATKAQGSPTKEPLAKATRPSVSGRYKLPTEQTCCGVPGLQPAAKCRPLATIQEAEAKNICKPTHSDFNSLSDTFSRLGVRSVPHDTSTISAPQTPKDDRLRALAGSVPPERTVSKPHNPYQPGSNNPLADLESDDEAVDEESNDVGDKPEQSPAILACPFLKANPRRYHRCAGLTLRDTTTLKQHLKRRHKRPDHYCQRCWKEFKTYTALDDHVDERSCQKRNGNPFADRLNDKAMALVMKKCKRTPTKGRSSAEQDAALRQSCTQAWNDIFRAQFPNRTVPSSPYGELTDQKALMHVHNLLKGLPGMVEVASDAIRFPGLLLAPLPPATEQVLKEALETVQPQGAELSPESTPTTVQSDKSISYGVRTQTRSASSNRETLPTITEVSTPPPFHLPEPQLYGWNAPHSEDYDSTQTTCYDPSIFVTPSKLHKNWPSVDLNGIEIPDQYTFQGSPPFPEFNE